MAPSLQRDEAEQLLDEVEVLREGDATSAPTWRWPSRCSVFGYG